MSGAGHLGARLHAAQRCCHHCVSALPCSAAQAAAKEGKKAAELAAALPPRLRRSLLFEVESSGLK